MKQPLTTISEVRAASDKLYGTLIYIIGTYCEQSHNIGWDGGMIEADDDYINVTKDSCFDDYPISYIEKRQMLFAATVVSTKTRDRITIRHIYRVPRMRPYLKVKTRLLEHLKPSVLIVHPKSTTAVADIMEAMQDAKDRYHIVTHMLSFRLKDEESEEFNIENLSSYYLMTLRDYLKECDWDLVCFVSGGSYKDGEPYYGILHDNTLINVISRLQYPSVCAVGHANEYRNFDHAFDDSIATPSLLGVKLKELSHKYYNKRRKR